MAKRQEPDRVKVTVVLPVDLVKTAKIAAIQQGRTLQALIEDGVRLALKSAGR